MTTFQIRSVQKDDCPTLVSLIRGLARYEKLEDQCVITAEQLEDNLFGSHRLISAVLGVEVDDSGKEEPVAFALYFYNFSTFLGKRGLYLEDIYVVPKARHKGYGKRIMRRLAKIAIEEGCGRFDWSVLDWNQPAIDFYESVGAKVLPDWRICRLTGEMLTKFASS